MDLARTRGDSVNVGRVERVGSVVGGGLLVLYGLSRRSLTGLAVAAAGGALVYRGATGRSTLYRMLDVNTVEMEEKAGVPYGKGIRVEEAVTVDRLAEDLYPLWRDAENLSRFSPLVRSVEHADGDRWHWTVGVPGRTPMEWETEVINAEPNRRVAWQSVPGAAVSQAGTVLFSPAPGGRGTEVRLIVEYVPPFGVLGRAVAKLTGGDPLLQFAETLRRFKQWAEAGEIPTNDNQPRGCLPSGPM